MNYTYKPKNKREREIRKRIFDRFTEMRDDPIRKDAEKDWEHGDKMYRLWTPERDPDDWRADLRLPDGFAAIQTYLQETIDLKFRPTLAPLHSTDEPVEHLANSVFHYNMEQTKFDYETFSARRCASIRGTAFTRELYILHKREVKMPDDVDSDGKITYKEETMVDADDCYTQHWPNEDTFVDERSSHIDYARDCIFREVLDHDTFLHIYEDKPGFKNVSKVSPAHVLDNSNVSYFQRAGDVSDNDVEVLHYYNKEKDEYAVLANNVVVSDEPIPFPHKQLPLAVWNFYPVEGRIYGMGIPHVIADLQEEREGLRRMTLDRSKMHLGKFFFINDMFDIDEDDLTPRPHGMVSVDTGGQSITNAVMPLEYSDMPSSVIRTDDTLREDERRGHGIDDRSQGVNVGGTATEAAILTEQSQKRINLVNQLANMDTLIRIGQLKWQNIKFFYKAPRVESVIGSARQANKSKYRTIRAQDKSFEIVGGEAGERKELKVNPIDGTSSFDLDKTFSKYMDGEFDVVMMSDNSPVLPKALRQARKMELFSMMQANPETAKNMDVRSAMQDILVEHDFDYRKWMSERGKTDDELMRQAEHENMIMSGSEDGKPIDLPPTEDATEMHTLVHLMYTETQEFQELPQNIKEIFHQHIMGEHGANPTTEGGEETDEEGMIGEGELPPGAMQMMAGGGDATGGPQADPVGARPQMQPADLQAQTSAVQNGGQVTNQPQTPSL